MVATSCRLFYVNFVCLHMVYKLYVDKYVKRSHIVEIIHCTFRRMLGEKDKFSSQYKYSRFYIEREVLSSSENAINKRYGTPPGANVALSVLCYILHHPAHTLGELKRQSCCGCCCF